MTESSQHRTKGRRRTFPKHCGKPMIVKQPHKARDVHINCAVCGKDFDSIMDGK